jgi:hypothetical protein
MPAERGSHVARIASITCTLYATPNWSGIVSTSRCTTRESEDRQCMWDSRVLCNERNLYRGNSRTSEPVSKVQDMYAAFARRDLETVLLTSVLRHSRVADDQLTTFAIKTSSVSLSMWRDERRNFLVQVVISSSPNKLADNPPVFPPSTLEPSCPQISETQLEAAYAEAISRRHSYAFTVNCVPGAKTC